MNTATNPLAIRPTAVLRWTMALVLVLYGAGKLVGPQFQVYASELDRPLGDVSGAWLTFHYFGYSPVYTALIAWVEIVGGMLLTFRRHATLGALILLPVLANIVIVDVAFGIGAGAAIVAGLLLVAAW